MVRLRGDCKNIPVESYPLSARDRSLAPTKSLSCWTATPISLLRGGSDLMRVGVIATAVSLCIVGLANADDLQAAMRKPTDVPAQGLGPALTMLAKEFD